MSTARSRKRFSREDWLDAARSILVDTGIDEVKVDTIAKRMNITRGSFYWHFKDRGDLHSALLLDWEQRNYSGIEHIRDKWESETPNLADCVRFWLTEDRRISTFDMAIRVWARKDEHVGKAVLAVDLAWIDLLTGLFRNSDEDALEAKIRARVIYFHQIGYNAVGMDEDLQTRLELAPIYSLILVGRPADEALDAVLRELAAPPKAERAWQLTR